MPIEAAQSAGGADPQLPRPVLHQGVGEIAGQSVLGGEGGEGVPIEATQSAKSADPQLPCPVLQQTLHVVVGQSVLGGEGGEGVPVVATHPAPPGADPQLPCAVLQQTLHVVVGQSVGGGEGGEGMSVIAAQSAGGADPQLPFPVYGQARYILIQQTVQLVESVPQPLTAAAASHDLLARTHLRSLSLGRGKQQVHLCRTAGLQHCELAQGIGPVPGRRQDPVGAHRQGDCKRALGVGRRLYPGIRPILRLDTHSPVGDGCAVPGPSQTPLQAAQRRVRRGQ